MTRALAALAVLLAWPAGAADAPRLKSTLRGLSAVKDAAPPMLTPPAVEEGGGSGGGAAGPDLRIQVDAVYQGLKGTADFVVSDAVQANHVAGGEKLYRREGPKGTASEYKKWGFVVNVLPATADDGTVTLQLQLELSGPTDAEGVDISTWQLQTEVKVKKGVKKTVASAAGRAEITITDAP